MIDTIRVDYEKDITKEILKKYSNFISKSSNLIDKKKCLVLKKNRNSTKNSRFKNEGE